MTDRFWVPVINMASDAVPPFGAMLPSGGIDSLGRLKIIQPDDADLTNIFFNGPSPIGPGLAGQGTQTMPALAAYSTEVTTAQAGLTVGTQAGYWQLSDQQHGFIILDGAYGVGNIIPELAPAIAAPIINLPVLSSTVINSSGVTTIYTVPAAVELFALFIILRITALSGATFGPIGNVTEDLNSQTLATFDMTSVTNAQQWFAASMYGMRAYANSNVKVTITTPAVATVYEITADIIGYLL